MHRRTAWRGLMLDSARHFQSPAFIRSMIDWMAWHKLNVLHWHLTDDQGWRLEIRKYPRLTSVGAWRIEPDGTRYGGFYTQDEVRDIVRFAAARHVQIVPEIEMPGHATAAIAAYPGLGRPSRQPEHRRPSPPIGACTLTFSTWSRKPFAFLEDVLAEVMELFPSRIIHIGGDEAVKDEWKASPEVQARARQLGTQRPRRAAGVLHAKDRPLPRGARPAHHRLGRDSAARASAGRHRHVLARSLRRARRGSGRQRRRTGAATDALLRQPAEHACRPNRPAG